MIRKDIYFLAIGLLFLSGCDGADSSDSLNPYAKMNSAEGMIGYLESLKLPALTSVTQWQSPYGSGLKIQTRHYDIYTTLLEPLMISEVPGFIESCYRGYNSQIGEPVESSSHLKIYLFATRRQWEDFTEDFTQTDVDLYKKIKSGAYYANGSCVVYNIGREKTFSVLGHEGWHQFNSRHFKYRLPSWLDEGIAMMFETSVCRDGFYYFEPAKNYGRLYSLKKTITNNNMIALERLIELNPGEVLTHDSQDSVGAFYAQSYALVRFLREESFGSHLDDYRAMLADGLYGKWPLSSHEAKIAADRNIRLTTGWNKFIGKKLFRDYITEDLNELESEYRRFCRKIGYKIQLK
ncbi:MAG: hypothetical protein ISS77_01715 [Phycisphaerae bacterium]|nr:hypothetical protein [Phycisphaerae bacterium]